MTGQVLSLHGESHEAVSVSVVFRGRGSLVPIVSSSGDLATIIKQYVCLQNPVSGVPTEELWVNSLACLCGTASSTLGQVQWVKKDPAIALIQFLT